MTNNEAFVAAIAKRINGNKEHGWGSEDSLAVIVAVVANENGANPEDYDAEFQGLIKAVVNPSAFRQVLESKGKLNETSNKRKTSIVGNLIAGL